MAKEESSELEKIKDHELGKILRKGVVYLQKQGVLWRVL